MTRLVALLSAALAILLAAACSAGPESPRALFDEFVRLHTAGDFGGTWTLLSDEGRRRWGEGIERNRDTLRRNPKNPKIATQYQVSDAEFLSLPASELWRRSSAGTERALAGAQVVAEAPAPNEPGVVQLDVETIHGQKFRWFVHVDGDRGWRYRNTQPLKLE
jgi:hypothetical protein